MTDEEIKALQDENAKLKTEAEEKTKLSDELTLTKQQLQKLQNKEFNFKKLRDMTQEEKDKLTDMEVSLKKQQEELEERQEKFQKSVVETHKKEALEKLSNGDVELLKRMTAAFDEFKGDVTDKEAIYTRAIKAATIAKAAPDVSAVGAALGLTGAAPKKEDKKNFADTEEGKGLAGALGLGIAKEQK